MSKTGEKMTRAEFLKKAGLGIVSIALFGSGLSKMNVEAAASVSDNLGKGGTHIGTTPPVNKNLTWIDTGNDGLYKYYDEASGTWKPTRSTWYE